MPENTRKAAEAALALACNDLGLARVELRFFEKLNGPSRGPYLISDTPIQGQAEILNAGAAVVWIRADLGPALTAYIGAHEARHIQQQVNYDVRSRGIREGDAERYAHEFAARHGLKVNCGKATCASCNRSALPDATPAVAAYVRRVRRDPWYNW
ncbi:MAG: hypothetical protein ACE5IZ_09420 [Dehalococcoidia bacterium]